MSRGRVDKGKAEFLQEKCGFWKSSLLTGKACPEEKQCVYWENMPWGKAARPLGKLGRGKSCLSTGKAGLR